MHQGAGSGVPSQAYQAMHIKPGTTNLEHQPECELVRGEICRVTRVDIEIVLRGTGLDEEFAIDVISYTEAGAVCEFGRCVGLSCREADISPPWIPPAAGGDVACGHPGVYKC